MLFSVATGYALRVLAALPDDGNYYLTRQMAEQLGLPGAYLSKVLQTLTRAGMLVSVRGPGGGFRLALPAAGIGVGAVIRLFNHDGKAGCILGMGDCQGQDNPCPLHHAWAEARTQLDWTLATLTVRDLQVRNPQFLEAGVPHKRVEKPLHELPTGHRRSA